MRFDLHVHTREGSACAETPAEEVVGLAEEAELDGVAFTDHDRLWSAEELSELKERTATPLVLLSGKELVLQGAHLLVFGFDGSPDPEEEVKSFVERVHAVGEGSVVAAHPFDRRFAYSPRLLSHWGVDAVEAANSRATATSAAVRQECRRLGLTLVGASDYHRRSDRLGEHYTKLLAPVRTVSDLTSALRRGRARPGRRGLWAFYPPWI